jgi:hypothetical protein
VPDEIELHKVSRSCMGIKEVDEHNKCVPCVSVVSAPNCFCGKHRDQREMLSATSIATFNDRRLPLSGAESSNRFAAAIDALQEDIKNHLKTALCSIADRTHNLKKRKEPPTVTQSEARKAIRVSRD